MRFRLLQGLLCAGVIVAFAGLLELTERSSSYFDLATYAETGVVRYRAGSTIYWGREGCGATTIGPGGMIVNKPLGAGARVLFLGDSYTEALQVSDAEKFTELVQAQYNQRFPARPIVTLNFAVSGQSATQHAADLAGLGPAWRPQIVVAQLSPYDFELADARQKKPAQPAYLAAGPDGAWAIQRQTPPQADSWRARATRGLIRARLFSTYARASWRAQNLLAGRAPTELANETPAAAPSEQQLAEYRQVTRFLLGRLARESQAVGARLVVLYTPLTPLLEGGKVVWNEQDISAGYACEQEIMRDVCQELGVPLWNPAPQLTRYVAETGQFPNGFANNRPGFGHLNAAGHRLVAGFLVEELAKLLNQ